MNQHPIVEKTVEFVKEELKNNDASHDWLHIERVWNNAKKIMQQEKSKEIQLDEEVVTLAAILHDVGDWKYSSSETKGKELAEKFLSSQNYPVPKIQMILEIMEKVSFHSELKGGQVVFPELAIVQDADRLDAIGAIGISRCMAFAGKKGTPIYDPSVSPKTIESKEDYMSSGSGATAINHFYEKLFRIKSMMKTETGRAMAEERHQFMVEFVGRLMQESCGFK